MNAVGRSCGVALIAALALGIYAHLHILGGAGEDYKGAWSMADRAFDFFLAAGLVAVAFCMGRAILRVLSFDFANIAEELSFSIMMGTGVAGLLMLAIGLAGLLKALPVALVLAALIAASRRETGRLRELFEQGLHSAWSTRKTRYIALSFCLLATLLVLRTAAPPRDYDEAIYHLAVGKLFVLRGRVYPTYDNLLGNMPFLLEMVYTIFLIAKADIAAKLFSLFIALASSVAVYGFCARFLNRATGLVAMFGYFAAGMIIQVAVTSRVDISLAFTLFLATYAMIVYFETRSARWLYGSAIYSGFALGIKYNAFVWLGLLGLLFIAESLRRTLWPVADRSGPFLAILKSGLLYAVIALAVASPWYIKNLVWFHNPIYPMISGELAEYGDGVIRFFNREDQSRIDAHFAVAAGEMPEIVGNIRKSLAQAASLRLRPDPLRVWEYFTKPDLYSTAAESYHDPNNLFFVLPLVLFFGRRRWTVWLLILSAAFYVFFASLSWVARFMVPIYAPLTIVVAYALTEMARRFKTRAPIASVLPAIAIAVAIAPPLYRCAYEAYGMGNLSFIRGAMSRREIMYSMFYYPPIDYINRRTPEDAKVMMIGAQMNYDMQRDYVADVSWQTTEWRRLLIRNNSVDEINRDLKRRGVTHILFSPGLFQYAASVGSLGLYHFHNRTLEKLRSPNADSAASEDYDVQLKNWATFELYGEKFLEAIYHDRNDYYIFRLK